ncbi:NAD-binding protein [Nocardioides sp. STR2]|uniref:NAD-binding protein n=1 Tax=Nocardioides pini TaxID=2975053 RepID=A0ABT4CAG2_9ACTN|nr:NAD-binding protein [Nocardioides pini]MCY4725959.1 NAD-binding protein [Nocardioides pini]
MTRHVVDGKSKAVFSGVTILHVNHLLEDVLTLNEILRELGATIIYVPVMYGSVREPPKDLAYQVIAEARPPDRNASMRDVVTARLELAIGLIGKEWSSTLVLEDGGRHYSVMLDRVGRGATVSAPIAAVEQTRRGAGLASAFLADRRSAGLRYPIVTIARSMLKIRFENVFVATRIIEELSLALGALGDFLPYRRVVVVGYGILGRAIAKGLRTYRCDVVVVEKDPHVRSVAAKEGFLVCDVVRASHAANTTVVIGATGSDCFALDELNALRRGGCTIAYLVSASSGTVEFARLQESATGRVTFPRPTDGDIWRRLGIRDVSTGSNLQALLVAEGFPINFFRPDSESLAPRVIDPINAEMLVAAQWLLSRPTGVTPRVYKFGWENDELPIGPDAEMAILRSWLHLNHMSSSPDELNRYFDRHPAENQLLQAP